MAHHIKVPVAMWFYIWLALIVCCVLAVPIAAAVESSRRKRALAALQRPQSGAEAEAAEEGVAEESAGEEAVAEEEAAEDEVVEEEVAVEEEAEVDFGEAEAEDLDRGQERT